MSNEVTLDILNKKQEYNTTSTNIPLSYLVTTRDMETIYSDNYLTVVKDKEKHDIFVYHSLKNYGVHVKYTPPVTIYREGVVVLYANEYDELLKIGSYVKMIDNFTHLVSTGDKEFEVSFVILYKGNSKYLGKKLNMEIMKRKSNKDDEPLYGY